MYTEYTVNTPEGVMKGFFCYKCHHLCVRPLAGGPRWGETGLPAACRCMQTKVIVTSKIHTKAADSDHGKKQQDKSIIEKFYDGYIDNSTPTSEPKVFLADAESFPGGLLRCVEINATNT